MIRIAAILIGLATLGSLPAYSTVDLKQGTYAQPFQDLTDTDARAFPLWRNYSSASKIDGVFGKGWCSLLQHSITRDRDGNLEFRYCGTGTFVFRTNTKNSKWNDEFFEEVVEYSARSITRPTASSGCNAICGKIINDLRESLRVEYDQSSVLWMKVIEAKIGKSLCAPNDEVYSVRPGMRLKCEYGYISVHNTTEGEIARFDAQSHKLIAVGWADGFAELTRDSKGNLTQIHPRDHLSLTVESTPAGKIKRIERSDGVLVEYKYNSSNEMTGVRNAWNNTYKFEYANGRLTAVTWPDRSKIQISYDHNSGRVMSFRDRNNCVEDYASYNRNRTQTISLVKRCGRKITVLGSVSYDYDHNERLTYQTDDIGDHQRQVWFGINGPKRIEIRRKDDSGIVTEEFDDQLRLVKSRYGNLEQRFTYSSGESLIGFEIFEQGSEKELQLKPTRKYVFDYDANNKVKAANSSRDSYTILESALTRPTLVRDNEGNLIRFKWTVLHSAVALSEVIIVGQGSIALRRASTLKNVCLSKAEDILSDILRPDWDAVCSKAHRVLSTLDPVNFSVFVPWKITPSSEPKSYAQIGKELEVVQSARDINDFDTAYLGIRDLLDTSKGHPAALTRNAALISEATAREAAQQRDGVNARRLYRLAIEYYKRDEQSRFQSLSLELATWLLQNGLENEALNVIDTISEVDSGKKVVSGPSAAVVHVRQKALSALGRNAEAFENVKSCYENTTCRAGAKAIGMGAVLVQLAEEASSSEDIYDLLEQQRLMSFVEIQFDKSANFIATTTYVRWLQILGKDEEVMQLLTNLSERLDSSFADETGAARLMLAKAHSARRLSRLGDAKHVLNKLVHECTKRLDRQFCSSELALENRRFADAVGDQRSRSETCAGTGPGLSGFDPMILIERISACLLSSNRQSALNLMKGAEELISERLPERSWRRHYLNAWRARMEDFPPSKSDDLSKAYIGLRDTLGISNWRTLSVRLWQAEGQLREGNTQQALITLLELFPNVAAADIDDLSFVTRRLLAEVFWAQNRKSSAIFLGKQAIASVEKIRLDARLADESIRQSLLEDNRSFYQTVAGWLIEEGRLEEAELVLGILKRQELYAFTRRGSLNGSAIVQSVKEKALFVDQNALMEKMISDVLELDVLLRARAGGVSLSSLQKIRLHDLQKARRDWGVAFEGFMAQLEGKLSADKSSAREQRFRIENDSRTMQASLQAREDTGFGIHFVVTAEEVAIVLSSSHTRIAKSSRIKRSELYKKIAAFRDCVSSPIGHCLQLSRSIYDLLFGPIKPELDRLSENSTLPLLVLSLTDQLRYIPFAALHDGTGYLIAKYAILLRTEAGKHNPTHVSSQTFSVAAFGVTRAVDVIDQNKKISFSSLPSVRKELESIVRTETSPDGALPGTINLDEKFDRESLFNAIEGIDKSEILHLASHFRFSPTSEIESYLVLGDGERLSLLDMKDSNLNGFALIALSACDTARGGGTNERGSEIEGLAASLQRAGASAVLGTLWPVADESTSKLMSSFYQLFSGGMRSSGPAKALRAAQSMFLGGDYSHPYYWSAFVIMESF